VRVGFIGLGSMGLPMAQRIASAGHELTVYARRASGLEPFADTNVTVASTPADMGAIDALCICVFDAAGVEEVLFGPNGAAPALAPGTVVLVHSTVAPAQMQRIGEQVAAAGLRCLDAPVSGGQPKAVIGELTMMIGGDTDTLGDVAALVSTLSTHVVHLGDIGAGSIAKLINNTLLSAQIALADDAMRAGEALGIDQAALAEVLTTGSSTCVASGLRMRVGSLAAIAATPAGPTLAKDVELMDELLGEGPGRELVEAAQRFIAAMSPGP
jgi:3-hydroxyisobutyrate dehydrogenase-like beta-hydroxyacid dehydrogenase